MNKIGTATIVEMIEVLDVVDTEAFELLIDGERTAYVSAYVLESYEGNPMDVSLWDMYSDPPHGIRMVPAGTKIESLFDYSDEQEPELW